MDTTPVLLEGINTFVTIFLIPSMLVGFVLAIIARLGLYFTVLGERKFTREFEARVDRFVGGVLQIPKAHNFHDVVEDLLKQTHYEHYRLKAERRRRRFDRVETVGDRLLGIEKGAKRVVEDTLKSTRYFDVSHGEPNFDKVARYVFNNNPVFNRVFGIFPAQPVDNLLNSLPGMFIVCGILGTFVGIVGGIPALKSMDITNFQQANQTLTNFLQYMSFAMVSSIVGMVLSLLMTLVNTLASPYGAYVELVDGFKSCLAFVWDETKELRARYQKELEEKRVEPLPQPGRSKKVDSSARPRKARATKRSLSAGGVAEIEMDQSPVDLQKAG